MKAYQPVPSGEALFRRSRATLHRSGLLQGIWWDAATVRRALPVRPSALRKSLSGRNAPDSRLCCSDWRKDVGRELYMVGTSARDLPLTQPCRLHTFTGPGGWQGGI